MIKTIANSANYKEKNNWYYPPFSHEHGVYVMLLISLVTGTIWSHLWTINTILAGICAFFAFQMEHPLVLQIKQRRSWKLRWLFWAGIYGIIAGSLAIYLLLQHQKLAWIYGGAILALIVDLVAVRYQQQKSVLNELISFSGICLATVFVYVVNTGIINHSIIGLWLVNTLFFSSAIFTVKFRKPKSPSVVIASIYHAIAFLIILGLVILNWLSPWLILAFGVAVIKFMAIVWQQDWYRQTEIKNVALWETLSSLLFTSMVLIPHLLAN